MILERSYLLSVVDCLALKRIHEIKMTVSQHGASLGVSDNWDNHLNGTLSSTWVCQLRGFNYRRMDTASLTVDINLQQSFHFNL